MKTVLITGASSGIGKELAYIYATKNYNLVLAARRKDRLEEIKGSIKNKHSVSVEIFDIDLSKLDSAEELYKKVSEKKIKVDVLINNAGFGMNGGFNDIDIDREENMLILNMLTLTKLTRLFVMPMIKAGNGNIVNIASTAAFQAVPKLAAYSASKAYVLSFSEAIAYELRDDNIKVTTICPGPTQSEFAQVARMEDSPFSKAPTSRDLAEFTYKRMKEGKVTAIHGFKNNFLTFIQRFVPRQMTINISAKMMEK